MRVAVIGMGFMGVPTAWALTQLGHEIHIADSDPNRLKEAEKILEPNENLVSVTTLSPDEYGYPKYLKEMKNGSGGFDLVVSCAPYMYNETIADFCFGHEIHYCDLGGSPSTTDNIHRQRNSFNTKSKVFCDLGLAPGWVNILAEGILQTDSSVTDITLKCGGLPVRPTGTLLYNLVFNIDGLVKEYSATETAKQLENGQIVDHPTLSGTELLTDKHIESFYTVGGLNLPWLTSLKDRGVKNCNYKTIRNMGHSLAILFLRDECFPNKPERLREAILNACPPTKEDLVLIHVSGGPQEEPHKYHWQFCIRHTDQWTAMQQCTAFPTAVVVDMILNGKVGDNDILSYSDVDLTQFNEGLSKFDMRSYEW